MACISKITASFDYDCDSGATGISEALLIEKADISGFAFKSGSPATVESIALSGAVRRLETPKRVLVLNSALKVNDGAPNAFTHSGSLTLTTTQTRDYPYFAYFLDRIVNPLANSAFVIIARTTLPGGLLAARIFGLYYGMSATGMDYSTHDNGGWTTVTFSTPENVIGEDNIALDPGEYDRLKALAV